MPRLIPAYDGGQRYRIRLGEIDSICWRCDNLADGDYDIIFQTPGTADAKKYDLKFTIPAQTELFNGDYSTDITFTLTSN